MQCYIIFFLYTRPFSSAHSYEMGLGGQLRERYRNSKKKKNRENRL